MKGFLGIKKGMSLIFDKNGNSVPVSIIQFSENIVTKKMTKEKDGYVALQISAFDKKIKKSKKSEVERFKKAHTVPKLYSKEIRNFEGYDVGDKLDIYNLFKKNEIIDVIGISKGKGFSGAIKKHNQSIGPKGHGSGYHRGAGSMGPVRPARVFKNTTLPGRMGNARSTVQNLVILDINLKLNIALIKGSVPGSNGSLVLVQESRKKSNKVIDFEIYSNVLAKDSLENIQQEAKKQHDIEEKEKEKQKKEEEKKLRESVENKERI